MKKNELKELKIEAKARNAARADAFTTYSAACLATDAAWDAYNDACEDARKAADASNLYEAGTHGCYVNKDK